MSRVTIQDIETYQRAGVARNMAQPGPYASENRKAGETGRFFDDDCNWQRIPEFGEVVRDPMVAEAAGAREDGFPVLRAD